MVTVVGTHGDLSEWEEGAGPPVGVAAVDGAAIERTQNPGTCTCTCTCRTRIQEYLGNYKNRFNKKDQGWVERFI